MTKRLFSLFIFDFLFTEKKMTQHNPNANTNNDNNTTERKSINPTENPYDQTHFVEERNMETVMISVEDNSARQIHDISNSEKNSASNDNDHGNDKNNDENQTDRYLKILCRLYPYQSRHILSLILKGCDNDVIQAIESILPTHVHTGKEWIPRDYSIGSFPLGSSCDRVPHDGCTHENGHQEADSVAAAESRSDFPYSVQDLFSNCFGSCARPRCFHGDGCCGSLMSQNVYFPHCY